jgi:hypothetical protein
MILTKEESKNHIHTAEILPSLQLQICDYILMKQIDCIISHQQ